jgi:radical SAM superfamily enzyme YgiQ (UPF0313 family)
VNKLIVGLYFPEYDFSFVENGHMSPGLLDVLPPGDNVKFCRNKQEFSEINDDDVFYYVVSVYTSGFNKFREWAQSINKNKIIVGGYHASLCPEDFKDYAFKIVTGPCNDLYSTIQQPNQIIKGIVNYKYLPRYDLFKRLTNFSHSREYGFRKTSIYTTMGCTNNCDFCCTPVLTGGKFLCKPTHYLQRELEYLRNANNGMFDSCTIYDENLLKHPDWKLKLKLLNDSAIANEFIMFSSCDILSNINNVESLKSFRVKVVIIGAEDIDILYAKNKNIKQAIQNLQSVGIYNKCSFIINPLDMVDPNLEKVKYDKMFDFLEFANPSNIHCNILAPYPKTPIHERLKNLIDVNDYDNYDRIELFIKDEKIAQRIWDNMHLFHIKYFTSDKFKQATSQLHQLYCIEQIYQERKLLNLPPL